MSAGLTLRCHFRPAGHGVSGPGRDRASFGMLAGQADLAWENGDDQERTPWPLHTARMIAMVCGRIEHGLSGKHLLAYCAEWGSTPQPDTRGVAYLDAAFVYGERPQAPLQRVSPESVAILAQVRASPERIAARRRIVWRGALCHGGQHELRADRVRRRLGRAGRSEDLGERVRAVGDVRTVEIPLDL